MILKKIYISLMNLGFNSVGVNRDNISLFQRVVEQEIYIVTIFDCPSGLEYTRDQISYIDKQINSYYYNKGYSNVNSLGIICTMNVDNVKEICSTNDNFWIIDVYERRLIIYEEQKSKFLNLEDHIANILSEQGNNFRDDDLEFSNAYPNNVSTKSTKSILSKFMSEWNTILIVTNILIYIIVNIVSRQSGKEYLVLSGALYWPAIVHANEFYRLLTYMFLHANVTHLSNNMLVLFFLGDNLERAAGKWRFLALYFGTGIIAGITSMYYNMVKHYNVISVGASGAIFGVVGAMVNIVIRNKGRLENISARQMVLFVIFSLYGGLTSQGVDNAAHIGGLISGFILAGILYRKPKRVK